MSKESIEPEIASLLTLEATSFENLAFDLLSLMGMKNLSWRTPGADGGRDIEGDVISIDFAGGVSQERWYIECKRYASTVDWPTVWQKIAYADSGKADNLLLISTASFSPRCLDEVNKWNLNRQRPHIHLWPGHELDLKLGQHAKLLHKYGLAAEIDASPSLAFLALHIARCTMAATSSVAFGGSPGRYLEAATALSELLLIRTEDAERVGRFGIQRQGTQDLPMSWAHVEAGTTLAEFDSPTLAATLALLGLLSKGTIMVSQGTDKSSIVIAGTEALVVPESSRQLLIQVAVLGDCELKLSPVRLRQR